MDGLRPFIRKIAENVLRSNGAINRAFFEFQQALRKRDEETERRCKTYGLPVESRLLKTKMTENIYARLGNQIIQFAVSYKNDITAIETRRSGRIATKHIKRRRTNGLLDGVLGLAAVLRFESQSYFWEYLNKLKQFERERQPQRQSEMEM
jgi:hypothetical protein